MLKSPRADVYPAVIRAAQSMLLDLPAAPELKPLAPDFARALYALDHPNEAKQWLDLADPAAAATVLPLAHIAAGASGSGLDRYAADRSGRDRQEGCGARPEAGDGAGPAARREGTPVPDTLIVR
ncbi:MAG: hypothetical protein WDN69_25505 [Aliidongia sp.]